MQFQSAIIAPGPAVEADDERPLAQQRLQGDEAAVGIGHQEVRQHFANRRNKKVRLALFQARDEVVIGRFEIWKKLARLGEIELQPLVERSLKGIGLGERLCPLLVLPIGTKMKESRAP